MVSDNVKGGTLRSGVYDRPGRRAESLWQQPGLVISIGAVDRALAYLDAGGA